MILNAVTDGQGPETIVVLHGLLGASSNFGSIAKGWQDRYQVIRLDLRNHGKSPHAPSMQYRDMADDVFATLDELNVSHCHLVGHSMGGKVAMTCAIQDASRIDKLVVADIAPVSYPVKHDAILAAMRSLPLHEISSRQDADTHLQSAIPEKMVRQFVLSNLLRVEGKFVWRVNVDALIDGYADIRGFDSSGTPFHKPVLFIAGERSDYIQADYFGEMTRLFPAHERVTLVAGHWVHAEQPQQFIELVDNWL